MNSQFYAYRSFNLCMVKETIAPEYWGEPAETILHGPYMDVQDAYEQLDRPSSWRADNNVPQA